MSNETKDLETFFPVGKEVMIRKEKFNIIPFVLKTRTVVLRLISEIFEDLFSNNPNLKSANTTAIAFAVIKEAGERLVEIYEIVLKGKDREWMLNNITIKNEVEIILAIIEVNDFPFLMKEVRRMVNQTKEVKKPKA